MASFADPFQLLFAGAFYGGLFQEGRSTRFLCEKCQRCRRKPLLGTFPNVHCFNGCQRVSNETSLTKAVTASSDAVERPSQCVDLYPYLGPSHAVFAPHRVTRSPRPAASGRFL